jgi:DNA gyrase subunit A
MARDCLIRGITKDIRFKSEESKKEAAKLRFTERQATAILEMRLAKLIGLEVEALIAEHEETLKNITRYEDILNNYESMAKVIIEDLDAIKKEFGRPRRTLIENQEEAVVEEPKIVEEEVVFVMDRFGYAKLLDTNTYEKNKDAADADYRYIFRLMNTDRLCIFTDKGKLHTVKVADLPSGRLRDKGVPIDNVSNFSNATEEIVLISPLSLVKASSLFFATKTGMIKKVNGAEFDSTNRTIMASKLDEGDAVILTGICDDSEYVVLQTHEDYFLRFPVSEAPDLKKTAKGVRGMKLGGSDFVEHGYLLQNGKDFAIEFKDKHLTLNRLKLAKRGGKGSKAR